MALKGLQSWSVKEAGAPVTRAEILTATSATAVSTSGPTRALMGVVVPAGSEDLTLTMADEIHLYYQVQQLQRFLRLERSYLFQLQSLSLVVLKQPLKLLLSIRRKE